MQIVLVGQALASSAPASMGLEVGAAKAVAIRAVRVARSFILDV